MDAAGQVAAEAARMSAVELVVDTNVVSYLLKKSALGLAYERLIGDRIRGVTGSTIAELCGGAVIGRWGEKRCEEQLDYLEGFAHVPETADMARLCGVLRGQRSRIGRPIDWPDAWAAACALWLDVPLVTHDKDLEGIPGLRVETLHQTWRLGEPEHGEAVTGGLAWHVGQARWFHVRGSEPTVRPS